MLQPFSQRSPPGDARITRQLSGSDDCTFPCPGGSYLLPPWPPIQWPPSISSATLASGHAKSNRQRNAEGRTCTQPRAPEGQLLAPTIHIQAECSTTAYAFRVWMAWDRDH